MVGKTVNDGVLRGSRSGRGAKISRGREVSKILYGTIEE